MVSNPTTTNVPFSADLSSCTDEQLLKEVEIRILMKTERIEYLTEELNKEYNK